jgi:hypothetical protein
VRLSKGFFNIAGRHRQPGREIAAVIDVDERRILLADLSPPPFGRIGH